MAINIAWVLRSLRQPAPAKPRNFLLLCTRKPVSQTMHLFVEYIRQFGRFQRNARLYILSYALSGVTTGIFFVLYNLYLVSLGYRADFVGAVLFVGTIGAGLAIFPAGLCVDRFSSKWILIASNALIALCGVGTILFRQPIPLLISGFIAGIGTAFTLVINAPFLTRNSTPVERPHLFSFVISISLITTVIGEVVGGALPAAFRLNSWLMAPLPPGFAWLLASQADPRSYQLALLFAGLIAGPLRPDRWRRQYPDRPDFPGRALAGCPHRPRTRHRSHPPAQYSYHADH